jgi:hypothetical protein
LGIRKIGKMGEKRTLYPSTHPLIHPSTHPPSSPLPKARSHF